MEPSSLIESLRTTMTLSYAWQYDVQVRSLRELYTKSKDLQWDGARALPWHLSVDPDGPNFPDEVVPIYGHPQWDRLTQRERVALKREVVSWMLSQFLHGEQGALLATSQIVTTVQSMDAKFYGATQVMDEARHVEVYARYLSDKMQLTYPVTPTLKQLLDVILTDSRWDFKYLGMQIMVEGLALAAFGVMREMTDEPLLKQLTGNVIRDEARHVAFGVLSLKEFYEGLTDAELLERQEFAFEAAVRMRDRFLQQEVWDRLGVNVKDAVKLFDVPAEVKNRDPFQQLLFSKIVPNCKKLGLLDANDGWLRKRFDTLGVTQFEDWADTGEEYLEMDAVSQDRLAAQVAAS